MNGTRTVAAIFEREGRIFPIAYEEIDCPMFAESWPRSTAAHYHPMAFHAFNPINLIGQF